MAVFVASMIVRGSVTYLEAVSKRPDLKDGIDAYLFSVSRSDLIVAPE